MKPAEAPYLHRLIGIERRRQKGPLALAAGAALVLGAVSVLLLGLSGWFITAAAVAGAASLAAAQAFNYLLPSAGIRLFAILRTVCRYGERVMGHEAALGALARLRPILFAALCAAPPREALALSSGEASARLVQDVDAIESLFIRLSAPWAAGGAVFTGIALAMFAGWRAGVALALAVAATLVATRLLAHRIVAAPAADIQRATGELKDAFAALSSASAELRCYGLEDWAADEIEARGRTLSALRRRATVSEGWLGALQAAVVGVGTALVIGVGARASPPLAALAGLSAAMAFEGLAGMARAFLQDGAVVAASDRLEPHLAHADASHASCPRLVGSTIEIGNNQLQAGALIGIGGPSGAGKTTLLERLVGLQPTPLGLLRVGGADLARLEPSLLRPLFAYAPQEVQLLAGTIRENLLLACPSADDAALWTALHDAGLDARIRRAPETLDLWIGENGARLSGGERRRLALARALLRPATWLLLDEPTEGLDAWTEALVLKRLKHRLETTGQGLLLVSHRIEPLRLCEQTIEVGSVHWLGKDVRLAQAVERSGAWSV